MSQKEFVFSFKFIGDKDNAIVCLVFFMNGVWSLIQQVYDIWFKVSRFSLRSDSSNHFTFSGNQKLCEIPFDTLSPHDSCFLLLHIRPQGIRLWPIDINLWKEWEGNIIVILVPFVNLIIFSGLLTAELVAWEC